MDEFDGMTRLDGHYYQMDGSINDVPAWRHFQTVPDRIEVGCLRFDGEWYTRSIRDESGQVVPAVGVWNPETDTTVVIIAQRFHDQEKLLREVNGPVLLEQLQSEEWMI